MNLLTVPVYPTATVLNVGQGHTLQYVPKTEWCALNAYLETLRQRGFRAVFENEVCGNYYATYASDTDYAHLYYIPDTRTARIISAPLENGLALPDFKPKESSNLSFPSTVTQSVLDYYYYDENDPASRSDGNFGACYIVTLDDGSLLVYDGGGRWGKNDVERIWGLLSERGTRNKDGKIVIAAWIITHEHVDHFWCMHHVILRHREELVLKSLYCTPITRELLVGRAKGDHYVESPDAIPKLRSAVGGFDLIRMHTGQVFYVRNVRVEVLCTPEDIFPEHADRFYDFNDTTTVTRLTVNGKTFLNLGDAYHVASGVMVTLWGNSLKSDYCTLAHHGWGGCTRSLYDHVLPSSVFVPFSKRWIDRILTDAIRISSSGKEVRWIQWAIDRYGDFDRITRHVFFDLLNGDTDRFLLADGCNKTLDLSTGAVTNETTLNEQVGYPY